MKVESRNETIDILFMTDWKISASDWATVSEGQLKGAVRAGAGAEVEGRGVPDGAGSRSRRRKGGGYGAGRRPGVLRPQGDGGGSVALTLGTINLDIFVWTPPQIVSLWRMKGMDRREI